jgi:hypothetical protein
MDEIIDRICAAHPYRGLVMRMQRLVVKQVLSTDWANPVLTFGNGLKFGAYRPIVLADAE